MVVRTRGRRLGRCGVATRRIATGATKRKRGGEQKKVTQVNLGLALDEMREPREEGTSRLPLRREFFGVRAG